MQTVDILRLGLFMSCGSMLIMALLFLFQRSLKTWERLLWGALAVCLPLLGPFLVIYCRPGEPQARRSTRLHWDAPTSSQGARRVR
jgi:hypothetical protein